MQAGAGNWILRDLSEAELAVLLPHLHLVRLEVGEIIADAGQPVEFVYFPSTAVLSLMGTTEAGASVEVAVVGREGVASVSAILGPNRLPFRITVQIAGDAWRIPTDVVARHLTDCGELHLRLMRYAQSVIVQVAQSAICNRFHNARQRLARWLLMTLDRTDTRELPLTHEFIAHMVGGPRSAVTEAAAELRDAGAIDYGRGRVTIRSLAKLQEEACECYAVVAQAQTDRS
jgi:CRP-like cAMP-binding protein